MASLAEVIFAIDTKAEKLCLDLFTKTDTPTNVILPNKFTALTYSIYKANVQLAYTLLGIGADATTFDEHNKSPLYYAVRYNFVELVDKLLEKGADPSAKINVDGWSCFHLACHMGHTAAVRSMLKEGGSKFANTPSVAGHTPLHLAARSGFEAIVKELLDKGAVPDAKDVQRRQTPLHLAAQKGHTACCVALLQADARLHEPDTTTLRKTPLELARDYQHFATAAAMLKAYNKDAE